VWDLALHPPATIRPLTTDFLARIAAAPRDSPPARSRAEVTCTVEEARELLRVLGKASDEYAGSGDDRRFRLASAGCSNLINAMKAILEGPAGSGSSSGGR